MSDVCHATLAELEAGLDGVRQAPKEEGSLVLIVRRPRISDREVLSEAVLEPLGMLATRLEGSAGAGMTGALDDLLRLAAELLAPTLVSAVDAEQIAALGYRSMGEILRSLRGVSLSNDRNYSYLGVRGFLRPGDYNSRVLFLIDGHRMNDNIYDAAYFARDGLLAVDAIERVEFVRGPSSSIYGSSAFFGIVNIVTKHGDQIGGGELAVSAESFGGYDGRFSYGRTLPHE